MKSFMYTSLNIIRTIKSSKIRWTEYVENTGKERFAYKVLVEKREQSRPLGRPRNRWEDGIKTDFVEIRWERMDWIQLAQYREQ